MPAVPSPPPCPAIANQQSYRVLIKLPQSDDDWMMADTHFLVSPMAAIKLVGSVEDKYMLLLSEGSYSFFNHQYGYQPVRKHSNSKSLKKTNHYSVLKTLKLLKTEAMSCQAKKSGALVDEIKAVAIFFSFSLVRQQSKTSKKKLFLSLHVH